MNSKGHTMNQHNERAELIRKLRRRAMASTNPDLSAELMDAAAMLEAQPAEQVKGQEAVEWADIPGYEGLYQACTDGRIMDMKTKEILSDKGRVGAGYVRAKLRKDGKSWYTTVHRVIALTFLGGIPEGFEVNHKNGIKTDNRAENLEVVTRSQNINHNYYVLGYRVRPVVATNVRTGESKTYQSVEQAVRDGFHSAHIYNVINGKRNVHRGHTFAFVERTTKAVPDDIPAILKKQAS